MTLKQWSENGWIVAHESSPQQVARLLAMVERDLQVAASVDDVDWSFGIAYNAVLKLCTVLLYASGFRAGRDLHHYRTLMALPLIFGKSRQADAAYLNQCRSKRNELEYEVVGAVSQAEASELLEFSRNLQAEATAWLKANHPKLM